MIGDLCNSLLGNQNGSVSFVVTGQWSLMVIFGHPEVSATTRSFVVDWGTIYVYD